ncbi:MAG: DUF4143 domain-containing protein [Blastocatellia bacterium]
MVNFLVCAHRGWTGLRPDDLGQLWEHYVLNELTAQLQTAGLRYWRDKQSYEVDLIWAPRGKSLTAIASPFSDKR